MMAFIMDRCDKVAEQASDYLDQNMSLPKRLKMRMHLLMCSHCREFVRQFELTVGAIKGLGYQNKHISDDKVEDQVNRLLKQRNQKKNE